MPNHGIVAGHMSRRTLYIAVGLAAAVAVAVVAVEPALAGAQRKGPRKATIVVRGGTSIEPNRFITDTMRFSPDATVIRSGGTITIRNRSREPHTLSLVRRSQQPDNFREMERCFEGGVCGALGQAHGWSEEGPPTNPLLDVGSPGFDRPGDSVAFADRPVSIKVTAKAGTTRHFLCAIHPWMQGRIAVR